MWRFAADTGGTFTDLIASDPAGAMFRVKVLSTSAVRGLAVGQDAPNRLRVQANWSGGLGPVLVGLRFRWLGQSGDEDLRVIGVEPAAGVLILSGAAAAQGAFELKSDEPAPIFAARLLTGCPSSVPLPANRMRLATTRGTNALLQRSGAPVVFVTTRGFGDLLLIDDQTRPDLFDPTRHRPAPLASFTIEVEGRVRADGSVEREIDGALLRRDAAAAIGAGAEVAAIALVHAWRNADQEHQVAEILRDCGFARVVMSSEMTCGIGLLERARTAEVEAYLAPIVSGWLESCRTSGAVESLHVMTSAGGLTAANTCRAAETLLSGPAGGVVGARATGRALGYEKVIGFDMGGTSTDVARIDGDLTYQFSHRVGPARLALPALAIETVAAGGGSKCRWVDGRLEVGPESAGADPGPACYGAGGPLTLTDVNLLLGRLARESFNVPVSAAPARAALAAVHTAIRGSGAAMTDDELLRGFLRIADERAAGAIRRISAEQGIDPADYALLAFGGAGPQHGCAVADALGMTTVLIPGDASLLSAVGLEAARVERFAEASVLRPLDECFAAASTLLEQLSGQVTRAVAADAPGAEITLRHAQIDLRLAGQEDVLGISFDPTATLDERDLRARYAEAFRSRFGYTPPERPVELVTVRVVASTPDGTVAPAPVVTNARRVGPQIVVRFGTSVVIPEGWVGRSEQDAGLILTRESAPKQEEQPAARPVREALFTGGLTAVAEEMGQTLARIAISTNVRDRRDYSCALLDSEGALVVNAPHIPVHLGALGVCVRTVTREFDVVEGDVLVTNHPAYGGSHLPDVTVISPAFGNGRLLGWVASRAHHAEIGGCRPGSMPPEATRLSEEGVVIAPRYLVRRGKSHFAELAAHLANGPWPSRRRDDNLADLEAQVAANQCGVRGLQRLVQRFGADESKRCLNVLSDRAAAQVSAALQRRPDGRLQATATLDDGAVIQVAIEMNGGAASIDFTGTSALHPGNFNATPAIVRSAIMYVLRRLVAAELPLNEGLMRPVKVILPTCLLNPDFDDDATKCPAVALGNVETSQKIVTALLRALELEAASPATMNNVLFGDERFGYYETVGGGAGASAGAPGASGVQCHMTNTRITDVEILEHRYPVVIEQFALRRGSGGCGAAPGGDGLRRDYRFEAELDVSVLTQDRINGPEGLAGGGSGAAGRQWISRCHGSREDLPAVAAARVTRGDVLCLETPGGGGFGEG